MRNAYTRELRIRDIFFLLAAEYITTSGRRKRAEKFNTTELLLCTHNIQTLIFIMIVAVSKQNQRRVSVAPSMLFEGYESQPFMVLWLIGI